MNFDFSNATDGSRKLLANHRRQKNEQRQYIAHMKIRGAINFLRHKGMPITRATIHRITGSAYKTIDRVMMEMAKEENVTENVAR